MIAVLVVWYCVCEYVCVLCVVCVRLKVVVFFWLSLCRVCVVALVGSLCSQCVLCWCDVICVMCCACK